MAERPDGDDRDLGEAVRRKAERRLKALSRQERTAWFGLGMFGLIGWSVVVPALLGIALGWWLDERTSGTVSWTLTFLLLGVALGCVNAWYWIRQESERD